MPFRDPIVAGTTLVREAIRSPNYVPGTSGWTINADGTAEFNSATFRGDLQSANYDPGVAGWRLDYDTGSAEFNGNFTVNDGSITGGTIQTAEAPNNRVKISASGGTGLIQFYSGDVLENAPAFIWAENGLQTLIISGADYGADPPSISMFSSGGLGNDWFFVGADTAAAEKAPWTFGNEIQVILENTSDASPTSTNHPFQIGPIGLAQLRMDRNEIMAVDGAGGTASLFINNDGGTVFIGNNATADLTVSGGVDAVSYLNAPSLDAARSSDTTARTTTSTTPVALTGQISVTVQRPVSGKLLIALNGKISNGAAGNSAFLEFEVRDTNSGGTQRVAPSSNRAAMVQGTNQVHSSIVYITDALAGSSTNLWIGVYAEVTAGTGTFDEQSLSVLPLP